MDDANDVLEMCEVCTLHEKFTAALPEKQFSRLSCYNVVEATFVQPFTSLRKWGLACNILLASRIFFISGERSEREREICLDTVASFLCHEGM